jgi:hypothetical protein
VFPYAWGYPSGMPVGLSDGDAEERPRRRRTQVNHSYFETKSPQTAPVLFCVVSVILHHPLLGSCGLSGLAIGHVPMTVTASPFFNSPMTLPLPPGTSNSCTSLFRVVPGGGGVGGGGGGAGDQNQDPNHSKLPFTCVNRAPSGGEAAALSCTGVSIPKGQSNGLAVIVMFTGPGIGGIYASISVPGDTNAANNGTRLSIRVL